MYRLAKPVLAAALILAGATGAMPVLAADYVEPPPVVEAPPEPLPEYGGWYIRGDIDYHQADFRGADYVTYGVTCCGLPQPGTGTFDSGEIDGSWSLGGGIGYQITNYLRTDLTIDYLFDSDFNGSTSGFCAGVACVSSDRANFGAWLMLANAYADLGTYYGFTPYVGAGIGGAHVKWDDLHNTIGPDVTVHEGSENWRFAYALMLGTSYCLTDQLKLDVGYRYSHINGGRMFELAPAVGGAGPGFDNGFNVHEGRAGLRWAFAGGGSGCYEPEPIPYEPEPVYK